MLDKLRGFISFPNPFNKFENMITHWQVRSFIVFQEEANTTLYK